MNEKYLKDLLYWVGERNRIRVKRKKGTPPPWTTDQILANNRFCNVRRQDDKVTKWIHDKGWAATPLRACIARMVNWPDTLAELDFPEHSWTVEYEAHWLGVFDRRRQKGLKSWTGAYMVTGGYSKGGEAKEVIIARVLKGAAERCEVLQIHRNMSLQTASEILETPGMGSFLVAQVLADLKDTLGFMWAPPDYWTWCAPGPGSTMGLNFLHDRPRTHQLTREQFSKEVNQVREILYDNNWDLCAHNTQNCLCELSKYIRAKYFGERLKNRYSAT